MKAVVRAARKNRNLLILYIILVVLIVVGGSASPFFFTAENLTNIINQAIPLGLVALGQTVVLLAAGLDLSVGSVMSIATVLGASMIGFNVGSALLYVPAMLALSIAFGATNGFLVTRLRLHPLIATICTGLVGSGIALWIMPYPGGYIPYNSVRFLAAEFGLFRLPMFYFVLISAMLYFVLRHTRFGRHIYAVGGNPRSTEGAGINVNRVTTAAYILSSLFAGLGGIFLACRVYSGDPNIGNPFTLTSIIVVLLGGTSFLGGIGGIAGTIAGALLLTIVGNMLNLLHVQPFYHYIFRGLLFVTAVMAYTIQWRKK